MNDYGKPQDGKPQDDMAQQDEQAHELIEQLRLLEAVDRRITPEHVAKRFRELLDDISDDGPRSAADTDPRRPRWRFRMPSVNRNLLTTLSGARPEILDQCPTERPKFQTLGLVILITCGTAAVSMGFVLSSALGVNPFIAVPVGLMWGLIVMSLDRWLTTSMPTGGFRRWMTAIPRVGLALLLAILISTPLVLLIFQSDINAQVAVIKEQQTSVFLMEEQHSQLAQRVTYWTTEVTDLQRAIESRGQAPLNPSTDPQVQSLTKQQNAELALEQKYYRAWQCQLYGGPGCPQGNGPLAHASEESYQQAAAQVATLSSEIQQRETQLTAADRTAEQARYQEAVSALPGARAQLSNAQAQEAALRNDFEAQNNAASGLLIRLQALNQLSGEDFTLNVARLLLFLLLLGIDCLPVMVRLLQRPGNYEKILACEDDMRLKVALMRAEVKRKGLIAREEEQLRRISGLQETGPAQTGGNAEPLGVADDLQREIESIYTFMRDGRASKMTAAEYREETEDCIKSMSASVNSLLRLGWDNHEIVEALSIAVDRVTQQLEAARQAVLEKELSP